MTEPTRATFTPMTDPSGRKAKGSPLTVHFNPESLTLTIRNAMEAAKSKQGRPPQQLVSSSEVTLALQLLFDTTPTGADVRRDTAQLAEMMRPGSVVSVKQGEQAKRRPAVALFEWNAFAFEGIISDYSETLDYFSPEGIPLRASVNLTLTKYEAAFPAPGGGASGVGAGSDRPVMPLARSDSLSDAGAAAGAPDAGPALAAANRVEDMRNPGQGWIAEPAAAMEAAAARGAFGSPLGAAEAGAAFGAGAGVGAGFGAGAGAGIGASFGRPPAAFASGEAGFGLGLGLSAGIGISAGAGLAAGASLGGGAGASAGALAGTGAAAGSFAPAIAASATAGDTLGLSGFAGLTAPVATVSAGASAGISFGAAAGAGPGLSVGAGIGIGLGGAAGSGAGGGVFAQAGAAFNGRSTTVTRKVRLADILFAEDRR